MMALIQILEKIQRILEVMWWLNTTPLLIATMMESKFVYTTVPIKTYTMKYEIIFFLEAAMTAFSSYRIIRIPVKFLIFIIIYLSDAMLRLVAWKAQKRLR